MLIFACTNSDIEFVEAVFSTSGCWIHRVLQLPVKKILRHLPYKSYLGQGLKCKSRGGFPVKPCILKGCFFLNSGLNKGL